MMDANYCYNCMKAFPEGQTQCDCNFDAPNYIVQPHHLVPGSILKGRYMIGRVLGEGGFGITYVGRDTILDMKVAVKEFYMSGYVNRNSEYSTEVHASIGTQSDLFEKNKDKFLTEARVLAKFSNEEGIVGIRDFFEENNTAYLVMDFLTGTTLKDILRANHKLTWQKTLEIMTPILTSLKTVHDYNVIHRDISPDNIMLLDSGKIKLLDFGAAREVSQTDLKSMSVILKPGYAPEEQYRSKGIQGPWTDIYAICATMYCCITGVIPEDSMDRMFEDTLRTPNQIEPSCPIAISNIIMRGMAVRQINRYQSIAELQIDLQKAMESPESADIATPLDESNDAIANSEVITQSRSVVDENATVYAGEINPISVSPQIPQAKEQSAAVLSAESIPAQNEYNDITILKYEGDGPTDSNPIITDKQSAGLSFKDSIIICFKKYFDFSGRASQNEYLYFFIFFVVTGLCTCGYGIIVTIIPFLAVRARRLHDVGKSGWYFPIASLIACFKNGDPSENKYGPCPNK